MGSESAASVRLPKAAEKVSVLPPLPPMLPGYADDDDEPAWAMRAVMPAWSMP